MLVLDEPTNDLDIETLELLEAQLAEYPGTLLIVSHDRRFLDNVVTSTFVFEGEGRVQEYVGGYDDWARQRDAAMNGPGGGRCGSKAGDREGRRDAGAGAVNVRGAPQEAVIQRAPGTRRTAGADRRARSRTDASSRPRRQAPEFYQGGRGGDHAGGPRSNASTPRVWNWTRRTRDGTELDTRKM